MLLNGDDKISGHLWSLKFASRPGSLGKANEWSSTKADETPSSIMQVDHKEMMIRRKIIREREAIVQREIQRINGAKTRGLKGSATTVERRATKQSFVGSIKGLLRAMLVLFVLCFSLT